MERIIRCFFFFFFFPGGPWGIEGRRMVGVGRMYKAEGRMYKAEGIILTKTSRQERDWPIQTVLSSCI